MKRIITAVLILVLIIGFTVWNALYIQNMLTVFSETVEKTETNGYAQSVRDTIEKDWEKIMRYLPYFVSYTELNRADEAVLELLSAMDTENGEDVLLAKRKLADALRRMKELERISPGGIL